MDIACAVAFAIQELEKLLAMNRSHICSLKVFNNNQTCLTCRISDEEESFANFRPDSHSTAPEFDLSISLLDGEKDLGEPQINETTEASFDDEESPTEYPQTSTSPGID